MGILCDGASSTLFCGEDRNSVLGLGDCDDGESVEVGSALDFFDAAVAVFPVDTDEIVGELIGKETDHLPQAGYAERLERGGLESAWRRYAMDWICKVHSYFGFGPLSLYLAVNYLDRFLSSHDLPDDMPWKQHLLSVACLSLAVKMEETVVPLVEDLQANEVFHTKCFQGRIVGRMEALVMKTLHWRMHAVTPFSFMGYFLDRFSEGKPPGSALASRCAKIIVGTLKGPAFLSFKPSEIAAAAAIAAVYEDQVLGIEGVLAAFEIPVDKEMVMRCYELMQGQSLVKRRHSGSHSAPHSPMGVLDAACFSFRSDDATLGSSQSNNRASKRRRLRMSLSD